MRLSWAQKLRRSTSVDIACDIYPESLDLSKSIQIKKGVDAQLNFDNDTEFSSDFATIFLRKNEKKPVSFIRTW